MAYNQCIDYFLRKSGNLYVHSQQGWESLNFKIKNFFFKRTQRAGKGSKGLYLPPIYSFFTRRLGWISGIGDALFNPDEPDKNDEKENDEAGEMYEAAAELIETIFDDDEPNNGESN